MQTENATAVTIFKQQLLCINAQTLLMVKTVHGAHILSRVKLEYSEQRARLQPPCNKLCFAQRPFNTVRATTFSYFAILWDRLVQICV